MIEAQIPFQGFYETLMSLLIDDLVETQLGDHDEYGCLFTSAWDNDEADKLNFKKLHEEISRKYVLEFNDWIKENTGLDVKFEFTALVSPREYNFTTDRLFANVSSQDLRKLRKYVTPEELAEQFREAYTSRSGFMSFYSTEVPEIPMRDWEQHQIGTLLEAVIKKAHANDDFDSEMYHLVQEQAQDLDLTPFMEQPV
jgi:hypothetical protein